METNRQALLEAALKLPERDRAIIAEELLATLCPDNEEDLDDGLAAELDRRSDEYQGDPTTAIPWSDLKAERD